MKIIFAKNIGFCPGVKRAIEITEKSLKEDPKPVQFLGEIIHNERVIKEIKKQGGKFVTNPKEAKSGTVIIRAHGTSPFAPPKNVLIRDATCPLVKRSQLKAQKFFKNGYQVIIIGEKNHPEVKGIKGYTQGQAIIIENKSQAKTPHFLKKVRGKKIGVVSQTTQNLDRVNRILKILKNKAKKIRWVNTLCPQVLARQRELKEILKKADGILVIGSHSSANTQHLAEIAKKSKKPAWRVNSLKELEKTTTHPSPSRPKNGPLNLKNVSNLGMVSGTSAPDWEIEKIKKWLMKLK